MPFAARITDDHFCPMTNPPPTATPHKGGPILPPGVPTVLIGGLPAATVGMCVCMGPPDSITKGSSSVIINGRFAARLGDPTAHNGKITGGCPTVIIGD